MEHKDVNQVRKMGDPELGFFLLECYSEIKKNEDKVKDLQDILSDILQDMGNTLIPNQRNLNGAHPFHKQEEPQEHYIGNTVIHQKGIDTSLELWHKAKKILAETIKG